MERFGSEAHGIALQQADAALAPDIRSTWTAIVAKITELAAPSPTTDHSCRLGEPDGCAVDQPSQ